VIFQSRWALSYLRGPLTREQISQLMAEKKAALGKSPATSRAVSNEDAGTYGERPMLPPGVPEAFLPLRERLQAGETLVYHPELLGEARVHFADAKSGIDFWENCTLRLPLDETLPTSLWEEATASEEPLETEAAPQGEAKFGSLPAELTKAKAFAGLTTQLKDHLYRSRRLTLYKAADVKQSSRPGEAEGDFRARLAHDLKEQRDLAVEKLRQKYATKVSSLEEQIRKAEQRVAKEKEQANQQTMSSMITFGSSILSAFLGRKMMSATNIGKAATSMRSAGRVLKERQDIGMAQETVEAYRERLQELEKQMQAEAEQLSSDFAGENLKLTSVDLQPKKADIAISRVALLWTPWIVSPDGRQRAG
jgi:hypothetical protein